MNSNTIPKEPYCQSCGMPLEVPQVLGTDAAGASVRDYCVYCFHNGAFTEPRISLEEMIERSANHLMKVEHLAHLQARDLAESVIPNLKRWASAA
jgi:Putative zinc ribbon domain